MTELTKDEKYWQVLEFLDKKVIDKELDEKLLVNFKEMIRDNKYVSTYIRALKLKMVDYKSIDDFIKKMDKHEVSKSFEDVVDFQIRDVLDSTWSVKQGIDPIEVINNVIYHAMEREGKICDFRDTVNPSKKFGRCESDRHSEIVEDDVSLTDEEQKIFDKIIEKDGYDSACDKFIDKFNPKQELHLVLYSDDDTSKYLDDLAEYVCQKCVDDANENAEYEVSCDME
jgi:hypothetical protein